MVFADDTAVFLNGTNAKLCWIAKLQTYGFNIYRIQTIMKIKIIEKFCCQIV